jgi:hypothetical protein
MATIQDSIFGAIIILILYHAWYTMYGKSWAIMATASVSSREYWKATDREVYEKRRQEYIDLHRQLSILSIQDKHMTMASEKETKEFCTNILNLLSKIRQNMFYDPLFQKAYDTVWIMSMHGQMEISSRSLSDDLASIGYTFDPFDRRDSGTTIHLLAALGQLCTKMNKYM